LKPMDRFFPVMWAGFWVNTISGTVLLALDATDKLGAPIFYVKMTCIALAITSVQLTRNRVFRNVDADAAATARGSKLLAASAILLWLGAITAGRLMAYLSTPHIVGAGN